MREDIARRWIADLESGPPQVKGVLTNEKGDCCLGRLCKLALQDGVRMSLRQVGEPEGTVTEYDGEYQLLPYAVQDWAGTATADGVADGKVMTTLNDKGASFAELAKFIRKHWQEL
jgi:hypothetical protein